MSDIVVKIDKLGKKYRLRHEHRPRYSSLRDAIADRIRSGFRTAVRAGESPTIEEFWALQDVNLEVQRGDVIGIIGRNGAGKSTLLKVLSRITEPTIGRIEIEGRIASLLEVGTGFHPELTGQENIYLNGAIMGMPREEIKKKFDEIVAFAEISKFLDTPVKRYSSGMYVRLAFAVAAHLEPDILIVDEVLAVGDAEFQKKCLGKIKSASKADDRTVFFVSHNMAAIQSLCNKIMFLQSGRVAGVGDPQSQIDAYLHNAAQSAIARRSGNRRVSRLLMLEAIEFTPFAIESGSKASFHLKVSSAESALVRGIAVLLFSDLGARVAILDLRTTGSNQVITPSLPLILTGEVESMPFVEGDYSVGLYLDCGDFCGDILDLTNISVTRCQKHATGLVPYSPRDRGLVELSYEFRRN
jgi:lipopolysaccharide transport system ATP-binding protein